MSSSNTHSSEGDGLKRVTLIKGAHRWEFACRPGEEQGLLASVSEMARRPEAPFDWFDAALVGHQIAARLRSGLNRVDKSVDEVR